MRTLAFQKRDRDERSQPPCWPDRQALIELLAAREQAAQSETDLAWIADRCEVRQ